jgi:hypothetical protein
MITFAIGLFIGYWIYPTRMLWKLYKIKRKIEKIEIDFMKTREDLHGKQWNEDNL